VEPDSAAVRELAARADAGPEDPFLFFRDARGHFRWWSFERSRREAAKPAAPNGSPELEAGSAVPRELLAALLATDAAAAGRARALLERLGPAPGRDVWISWRPLSEAAEPILALAGLLGGWAILREPADPLPPSTFAWARPTLLAGRGAELETLLEGFEAMAPRPFRARWLRRRVARLRALVCDTPEAAARLAARIDRLGGHAEVVTWPDAEW
jgi:hypothetical protein